MKYIDRQRQQIVTLFRIMTFIESSCWEIHKTCKNINGKRDSNVNHIAFSTLAKTENKLMHQNIYQNVCKYRFISKIPLKARLQFR